MSLVLWHFLTIYIHGTNILKMGTYMNIYDVTLYEQSILKIEKNIFFGLALLLSYFLCSPSVVDMFLVCCDEII